MHLRGRLNENQGTNKACNNILWQAGYKTEQALLHLSMAQQRFFQEKNINSAADMTSDDML